MERKTAANSISQSADIVSDNIDKLKQLFPSICTEGYIDFEALKDILGDKVETDPEYYRFTWPGKAMAKEEARKPSRGTLRPAKDESVNWDTTENLYIEGDNLEVLKLLQKSYASKVKMIYIDPPYNTGKDFVYKDNYKDNLASYNEKFNRTDAESNLKSSASETNQEGSARYHSNWLNMMYPRLTLARNLLMDDGAIFISIDDNEVKNLINICDEIFGESNFAGHIIWQKSKKGDSKLIAKTHEYILVYTKNKTLAIEEGPWRKKKDGVDEVLEYYNKIKLKFSKNHDKIADEMAKWYRNLKENDPRKDHKHYKLSDDRGLYFPSDFAGPNDGRDSRPRYDILHPITGKSCKKPSTGWRWDQKRTNSALESEPMLIHFGKDETTIPCRKSYLKETAFEPFSSVFYKDGRAASKVVDKLIGKNVFDFPKDVDVLKELVELVVKENEILLDFFSGSGSTAHATMQLNAEDEGTRKHIQVQLPEFTDEKSEAYKAGYKTIPEIGKERIRRAGKKILEENPEQKEKLDVGFKVFKLDESNIKTWETDPEKLDENLFLEDVIKSDRTEEDVLYEILLKYGLDLTLPIQEKEIENQKLYAIGGGALLVYLGNNANTEIAQQIISWAKELDAINPQVVFKDNGFSNSQDKVNTLQVLKSNKITDVWSI